jgi:hypothetical protein
VISRPLFGGEPDRCFCGPARTAVCLRARQFAVRAYSCLGSTSDNILTFGPRRSPGYEPCLCRQPCAAAPLPDLARPSMPALTSRLSGSGLRSA